MLFAEEIYFKKDFYSVLLREQDNLLMQAINEHKSIWKSYSGDVIASYDLIDYKLTLEDLILDKNLMKDNESFCGQEPTIDMVNGNKVFEKLGYPLTYTGGIIIAKDIAETFHYGESLSEYPCYCYQNVYELIFDQGILIMSVDHSKAMHRIRKNVEKGLRNLKNQKDMRCIQNFLHETFCKSYERNRKLRKIKKKVYKVKHKIHD